MARQFSTVIEFIQYGKINPNTFGTGIIEFEGFNSIGDGGATLWQREGTTGLTPSKTPTEFDDNRFTDAVGDLWVLVPSQIVTFNGVQFLPLPFGAAGNGGYYFNGTDFVFLANAADEAAAAAQSAADATAAAQRAEDAAASIEGQITTTQLINSNLSSLSDGDTIETNGFTTAGDGGGAQWLLTSNTNTPSQSPSQLGDAKLTDSGGREWSLVANALFIEQIGGKFDGSDNTSVLVASGAWSNSTKKNVYVGKGTILTDSMTFVANSFFSIVGIGRYESIIKLNEGANTHLVPLSGSSEFKAKSITFDQNCNDDTTQTGGHVIRSVGCSLFHLDDVLLRNAYSYGIGLQGGSTKGIKWRDVEFEDFGQDCIDVKDYNQDNDVIDLIGFTGRRFGKRELQQAAIDVRGPANISSVVVEIDGLQSKRALRLRVSGGQGRGASGVYSNIKVTGIGANDGWALDIASDTDDYVISTVECRDVAFALVQTEAAVGGQISGLAAKGLTGSDCIKFQGTGLLASGIKAENTVSSSRIYEFESTAVGNRLTNFILKDNSGNPSAGRLQAGATNNAITNGDLYGGAVGDGGTNTDFTGIRLL